MAAALGTACFAGLACDAGDSDPRDGGYRDRNRCALVVGPLYELDSASMLPVSAESQGPETGGTTTGTELVFVRTATYEFRIRARALSVEPIELGVSVDGSIRAIGDVSSDGFDDVTIVTEVAAGVRRVGLVVPSANRPVSELIEVQEVLVAGADPVHLIGPRSAAVTVARPGERIFAGDGEGLITALSPELWGGALVSGYRDVQSPERMSLRATTDAILYIGVEQGGSKAPWKGLGFAMAHDAFLETDAGDDFRYFQRPMIAGEVIDLQRPEQDDRGNRHDYFAIVVPSRCAED